MLRNIAVAILAAGAAVAADLPVEEVILYKNGVGYFRRAGELRPGESARLDFKASEMNDVLKSLTVFEEGGGRINGLRYDSSEPLETKLSEFPFRLGDRQPLSALLDQLKGARLELTLGTGKPTGVIVGAREIAGGEESPSREQVTLALDSGEVRTYDLASVSGVRFTDPVLQLQLKDYLSSLVAGRSKDKRSVYIDSSDAKARRIGATYVTPTPVWKSSYRLIFGEKGDPTLEGWAIVDNTTGEDWTRVRLALVSGRPVSFISRLYEPRYLQRQVASLPEDWAAAPEIHRGAVGTGGAVMDANVMAMAPPPAPQKAVSRQRAALAEMAPGVAPRVVSAVPTAQTRELGELFEYRFASPVTVQKGQSVMLPFLQQTVAARKLLIYSGGGENPRNAAEISNNTGKTLDGGPITVYDGSAYAGEALVETVKAGDKRLISYAVDLGVRISTAEDSSDDLIREVHARRGVVTTRVARQETKTFTIRNVDQKPKTLVLEHAIRPEYKLLKLKPSESTASAYRFEIKLAPGAAEKFPVAEERVYEDSLAVTDVTPEHVVDYVQNKAISDAARKQLERIVEQKRLIAAAEAGIQRVAKQIATVEMDENRVRNNISSLNRVSDQQQQVQAYARQLTALETRITQLRDQEAELQKKKAALEDELTALIEKMEF